MTEQLPPLPEPMLEEAADVIQGCINAMAMLRANGVFVWPNHPENPEQKARQWLFEYESAIRSAVLPPL